MQQIKSMRTFIHILTRFLPVVKNLFLFSVRHTLRYVFCEVGYKALSSSERTSMIFLEI